MDTRKIIQALAYIASKQPEKCVDNIKAYKLLWLADRYHLRHYGRTISGDSYYAMPKGVVPSDAKNLLGNVPTKLKAADVNVHDFLDSYHGHCTLKKEPNIKVFSKTDVNALDVVLEKYNDLSAEELSDLSHDFPEWVAYEAKLKDKDERNSHRIDMRLFFVNHDDGKGLFNDDEELLSLTKELYFSHYGNL